MFFRPLRLRNGGGGEGGVGRSTEEGGIGVVIGGGGEIIPRSSPSFPQSVTVKFEFYFAVASGKRTNKTLLLLHVYFTKHAYYLQIFPHPC